VAGHALRISGWPPTDVPSGGVDALGVTVGPDGRLYFGLGTPDYSNPYRVKDGAPLHLDVFTSGFMTENYKQLMLTMLQDVGFSTKLIAGTPADRTVAGSKGLYHLVNREFEASDPHYLVDLFASKNVGSFAWSMNKDPELDQILAQQDTTVDRKARQALVSRATRRILEQAYVVPIYITLFVWVTDANVKNFHMDARSWYPYFQDAWIES